MLEASNFVHVSAMRSLSFVMSECSLSGHGHGHVSNFYIVDLGLVVLHCCVAIVKISTDTTHRAVPRR